MTDQEPVVSIGEAKLLLLRKILELTETANAQEVEFLARALDTVSTTPEILHT